MRKKAYGWKIIAEYRDRKISMTISCDKGGLKIIDEVTKIIQDLMHSTIEMPKITIEWVQIM